MAGAIDEEHPDKWSAVQLRQWLQLYDHESIATILYQNSINGNQFLQLSYDKLKKFKLSDEQADNILMLICNLKQNIASRGITVDDEQKIKAVYAKLQNTKDFICYTQEVRERKARNLAVKDCLLESYLSLDCVAIKRTIMELSEDNEANPSTTGGNFLMSSNAGSGISDVKGGDSNGIMEITSVSDEPMVVGEAMNDYFAEKESDLMQIEQECNELIISDRMRSAMLGTESKSLETEILKVKLVVTEIHHNSQDKLFRRMISPVMSAFNMSPQFGFFHTALIVGPWYLEWTNSSLIIPRRCTSTAALLAADVGTEFSGIEVHKAAQVIAEKVAEWNASYEYSQHHKNCQHFVDEICSSLGIELNFGGALQNYIKQCRTYGRCEIKYIVPEEIQKALEMTDNEIEFKAHIELDDFVRQVANTLPDYFPANTDDWMLLKSFDRAFWLRSFRYPTRSEYMPTECSQETFHTSCPFNHPRATNSIVN